MKRMISMAIAVIMLLTVFTAIPVMAEETSGITQSDQVLMDKLEAFGVINIQPSDLDVKVTRREMADIIANYMKIPYEKDSHETTPFVDVSLDDVSIGAISALHKMQIITGDTGYRFRPDDNLKYDEALVFVVNAVGYKHLANREGGYPTGYHRIAIKLGFLKTLQMKSGVEEITLRDVYKMLEAGFSANAVSLDYLSGNDAIYKVSDTEDFLSNTYGITTRKGIVTGCEDTGLASGRTRLTDEQIEIDYVVYDTPGYIFGASLGRSVTYYVKNDGKDDKEVVFVEENEKLNQVYTVKADDLLPDKTTNDRVYYRDEDREECYIKFDDVIDVLYNGRTYKGYGELKNALPTQGYIEALDNDGDGEAEILFVYEYTNIVVESVDAYNEVITSKYTEDDIDFSSDDIKVYKMPENVRVTDINDIARGDVISVMESKGDSKLTTLYISRESVTGMVTESSDDGYLIDGTYYNVADGCGGATINVGIYGTFYLDYNGEIANVKLSAADVGEASLAVVAGIDYETRGRKKEISVMLYDQKGEFITANLSDRVKINDETYRLPECDEEDIEEILDSLGEKNDQDIYVVNSAYVVRYVMTDEEITSIDTGEIGTEGSLEVLIEKTTYMLARNGVGVLCIRDDGASYYTDYIPYMKDEVILFVAPSDGELDKTNDYGLVSFKENYYTVTDISNTTVIESAAVYSLGHGDIKRADVVLLRGAGSAKSVVSQDSSKLNVVSKITKAANDDGDIVKKFYLNDSDEKLLSDKISITENGSFVGTFDVDSDRIAQIKPGDVIQYGTDSEGYINSIMIVATYKYNAIANTKELVPKYNEVNQFGERTNNVVVGVVTEVDDETNGIKVFKTVKNEQEIYLSLDSAQIYVFNSSEEEVTAGTTNTIAVGDCIAARVSTYFKTMELIVLK